MRLNLFKRSSTHAERVMSEILKKNKIPFKYRAKVAGREVDFVVGRYAIEIDGHTQDPDKNRMLLNEGYFPIHYSNSMVIENKQKIEDWLKIISMI